MSIEEKISIKVIGSMMGYAAEQLAIIDDDFKSKLTGLNEIIQWKIGDDIAYYTEIKDGTIKAHDGTASNPTLTFELADVSDALSLFTQSTDIDMNNLLKSGKLKISGDAAKLQKLMFITDIISKYMEGLRGE